jgi:FkbM family methyltransferase
MRNERINMEMFVELAKQHFNESDIKNIMEIGSMNGADALYLKSQYPNSNVFCIEGLPDNYNNFLKDLEIITPINAVIADYDGEITYHQKNINGIHSIFDRGEYFGTTKLNLKCFTMKSICENYKIDSLDMVKIDVEGATFEIFKSMGDMLNTIKIMHIETEDYEFFKNQKLHNVVADFLTANGFTLIDITYEDFNVGNQYDSVWINNQYLIK